ncbi:MULTISPECIES: flagellar biosynthesis regulator FlaF [Edaphosphingomonas]|uniref:Flagellar FlaF family protein n=2 Tax=Edaphosphingomonas TaxID=3423724 RepID=A0A2T4I793_9SPHN|nr:MULTISPECIES: flagellar biosynthesis regulator FlaF [Sphingomonas]OHT21484.1 flagellar biosynthesis regulatory protein FlaF [Sphingomonas haloaromaticamans]PTD26964.1 flagellar FlaF family protein [Sphingomonas fennica]
MSLNAYHRAQSIVATPRATEHRLMSQITGALIEARDAGLSGAALMPTLHRNREVWTHLATICGLPGNQLPDTLRASIISIGLWVDRYTSDVAAGRDSIEDLITVNRAIIEGLSGENNQVASAAA